MDLLVDELTLSEVQHQRNNLKGTRDMWGANELSGFRVKTEGAAFSHTEVLTEAIVPLLHPLRTLYANIGNHHT